MALYHKWDVKNDFAYVLQFFSLISDGLGSVTVYFVSLVHLAVFPAYVNSGLFGWWMGPLAGPYAHWLYPHLPKSVMWNNTMVIQTIK